MMLSNFIEIKMGRLWVEAEWYLVTILVTDRGKLCAKIREKGAYVIIQFWDVGGEPRKNHKTVHPQSNHARGKPGASSDCSTVIRSTAESPQRGEPFSRVQGAVANRSLVPTRTVRACNTDTMQQLV